MTSIPFDGVTIDKLSTKITAVDERSEILHLHIGISGGKPCAT